MGNAPGGQPPPNDGGNGGDGKDGKDGEGKDYKKYGQLLCGIFLQRFFCLFCLGRLMYQACAATVGFSSGDSKTVAPTPCNRYTPPPAAQYGKKRKRHGPSSVSDVFRFLFPYGVPCLGRRGCLKSRCRLDVTSLGFDRRQKGIRAVAAGLFFCGNFLFVYNHAFF